MTKKAVEILWVQPETEEVTRYVLAKVKGVPHIFRVNPGSFETLLSWMLCISPNELSRYRVLFPERARSILEKILKQQVKEEEPLYEQLLAAIAADSL